jgi:hypothetical protein
MDFRRLAFALIAGEFVFMVIARAKIEEEISGSFPLCLCASVAKLLL